MSVGVETMVISMEHVSCIRDSHTILHNINWSVLPGEHWAIFGLNGSGKTTLLNIVNGYIYPSTGTVSVLDRVFGKYDLRELRKSVGWISSSLQERLYTNHTAENIVLSGLFSTIGLYDRITPHDTERARLLLEKLGCRHVTEKPYSILSQGEKQKVLIARGLINSPRLLILDEPCTGLDIFSREHMLETIGALAADRNSPSIIYVTHRTEEILPVFSNTLLLRQGRVFLSGRTDEIFTEANLSAFLETPVNVKKKNRRFWLELPS